MYGLPFFRVPSFDIYLTQVIVCRDLLLLWNEPGGWLKYSALFHLELIGGHSHIEFPLTLES